MFAYFDETVGGARKELTAVAGYLFDDEGHERFCQLYRQRIEPLIPPDHRGRRMFHAAPCFDGQPPFFPLQRALRESILARMAEAIRETVLVGVVFGIEKDEFLNGLLGRYMRVRRRGVESDSLAPWVGSKYSICLLRCIAGINDWLNRENIAGSVQYFIEAGQDPKVEKEAAAMLSAVAASDRLRRDYRVAGFRFRHKGPETPWLFAADYFAWIWQRNDRYAEEPYRDEYGDWQTPVLPLIEEKTHLAAYLTEASVNTQALINSFYGLMRPSQDVEDVGRRVRASNAHEKR